MIEDQRTVARTERHAAGASAGDFSGHCGTCTVCCTNVEGATSPFTASNHQASGIQRQRPRITQRHSTGSEIANHHVIALKQRAPAIHHNLSLCCRPGTQNDSACCHSPSRINSERAISLIANIKRRGAER